MGCGCGLDSALLWLWCGLAATAHATASLGTSICLRYGPKKQKKKKKKKVAAFAKRVAESRFLLHLRKNIYEIEHREIDIVL